MKLPVNEIICGDCLEVMKDWPDNSIDLILTDPPYGTTACKWDSIIPLEPMWEQLKRLIKPNGAIVMTASQPFTTTLIASNIKMFKYCWVWVKNRGSNFAVLKYQPMKEHEDVVVFGGKNYYPIKEPRKGAGLARTKYKYKPTNTGKRQGMGGFEMSHANHSGNEELRFPSSVQKFNCEVGFHPTQKPVALMEYLIKTYTNKGEVILDFTCGSGTTCVACVNTNRNFIGIEKEPKYCEIARKRIKEQKQAKQVYFLDKR